MSATAAFTDLEAFAGTHSASVSRLEADPFYLEPEINPDYCFEDIVGKSAALQKCCNK